MDTVRHFFGPALDWLKKSAEDAAAIRQIYHFLQNHLCIIFG